MAKQETNISNQIRLAVAYLGTKLFRNHVGFIKDKDGVGHRFGLCKGSSDCIGWTTVKITPEMVGRKVAVFTAIEVKIPNWTPPKETNKKAFEHYTRQLDFIGVVKKSGGISGFARCDKEAIDIVNDWSS